jgi:hypothetical protein
VRFQVALVFIVLAATLVVGAAEGPHKQKNASIPEPRTQLGIDVSLQHRAKLDEGVAFVGLDAAG